MATLTAVNPPWLYRLLPFLRWWPRVTGETVKADLIAGLTGAIIVLPQGVVFATIAGLPPQYGLYTAIVPAVIAAFFGSSWHLVSGPTTTISIVVFGSLGALAEPGSSHYIQMVFTLTILTGVFQLAMGLARLGMLVNLISQTVVVGFTSGAAILIATSQIKNLFGVPIARGTGFAEAIQQFIQQIGHINWYMTAVGIVTLATGILIKRYARRIPYLIAATVAGGIFASTLNLLFGMEQTGIHTVGALPTQLPPLAMPDFTPTVISQLAPAALALAVLGLTQAVSIARAVAVRSGQRIDGNQEFIGQGISNIIGGFFSAYASSGSFNRSGLNYEAGARTPLAAIVASAFLVVILLLVAPLAAYLPIAAMAAVLLLIAYGLIDFRHIGAIIKAGKGETTVLAVTFFSTLYVELEFAIYVGVMYSLILYLMRTSQPNVVTVAPTSPEPMRSWAHDNTLPQCPQLRIIRIDGPLFFGAVNHVEQRIQELDKDHPDPKVLIVDAESINFMDVAGAEAVLQEARRRRKQGGDLYIYGAKPVVLDTLLRGSFMAELGREHLLENRGEVFPKVIPLLNRKTCLGCDKCIFAERSDLTTSQPSKPA